MQRYPYQEYLGDGVYADFDGYQIWLRTSDGISYTNSIALEPSVLLLFFRYHTNLMERLKGNPDNGTDAGTERGA